jgi:hypothetical protein
MYHRHKLLHLIHYVLDSRDSIPSQRKTFFSALQHRDRRLGPTQPPVQWVSDALSWGVKRSGYEPHHSLPPSAEVKKGGAISLFPIKCKDRFICALLFWTCPSFLVFSDLRFRNLGLSPSSGGREKTFLVVQAFRHSRRTPVS